MVPLSYMSLKAWTPWELWPTVSPWRHSGEGSPEMQFLCCGSISQSTRTFQCLWLIRFRFFSKPCPSSVENIFVGLQHWWLSVMQRPPTRSYLLTQSTFIDWSEVFFSKRTPGRPGPFCTVLIALGLRKKQTRKGSSNASWKNELTSSFRRVRSHSETACCWAGREEHTVQPLFSATRGLRRHAEVFVVPRKAQGLGSLGLTNHSGVQLRAALTSACSVWQSQWLLLLQTRRERSENCRQKHYLSLTTEDLRLEMGIRKLTMISKIRLGNKPTETSNIGEG